MVIVDIQGRITFVNSQAENMFGYEYDELLHRTIECLMPERFRIHHATYREAYSENPYIRPMGSGLELYGVRKNGEEFPVDVRLSPLHTSQGTLMASSIRDITERKRLEHSLREKTREIELLYERERKIALTLQKASLPTCLPKVPGLIFHHYYEPGQSDVLIGGDWYDAFTLPDGRIFVSVGDVCGSGLNAAVIMSSLRQIIRGAGYACPEPILVLNVADQLLRSEYPNTIATAFVGVIDPIERTLLYASAGHPMPLIRFPDKTIQELQRPDLLLGFQECLRSPAERVGILAGSCLILFTDGLIEATHDTEEGYRRLRTALRERELSSSDIAKTLYESAVNGSARDDVAILAIDFLPDQGQPLECSDEGEGRTFS